jgi:hypothetical protein
VNDQRDLASLASSIFRKAHTQIIQAWFPLERRRGGYRLCKWLVVSVLSAGHPFAATGTFLSHQNTHTHTHTHTRARKSKSSPIKQMQRTYQAPSGHKVITCFQPIIWPTVHFRQMHLLYTHTHTNKWVGRSLFICTQKKGTKKRELWTEQPYLQSHLF